MNTVSRYTLILSPEAIRDIQRIQTFLAREASPRAAELYTERVLAKIETLELFPELLPIAVESSVFGFEVRQLPVKPYRVLYAIIGPEVHVLRLWHSARQPLRFPDDL